LSISKEAIEVHLLSHPDKAWVCNTFYFEEKHLKYNLIRPFGFDLFCNTYSVLHLANTKLKPVNLTFHLSGACKSPPSSPLLENYLPWAEIPFYNFIHSETFVRNGFEKASY